MTNRHQISSADAEFKNRYRLSYSPTRKAIKQNNRQKISLIFIGHSLQNYTTQATNPKNQPNLILDKECRGDKIVRA